MSEGFAFQANYKCGPDGQDMVNVRADDGDEFRRNLEEVEALAHQIEDTGNALRDAARNMAASAPQTEGQAVDTIRQNIGSPVGVVGGGDVFSFSPLGQGANSPREDALAAKGFVPDKWHTAPDTGGWWHPTKFPQAPACQCQGQYKPNQGKLALKVGVSQNGKEYKAWFCANTFGKGAKSGCPSSFNGPFPIL